MTRKELIRASLDRCDLVRQTYGDFPALESLRAQLSYLLDLEEGRKADRSRMEELSIPVLAAREIEDRDPKLADLLYRLIKSICL